jgi:uncharacterized protein VirK/YbjX
MAAGYRRLQGPRRTVPHEVIKRATRACYGLFPKRLLLEFIWALAARCTFRPFMASAITATFSARCAIV